MFSAILFVFLSAPPDVPKPGADVAPAAKEYREATPTVTIVAPDPATGACATGSCAASSGGADMSLRRFRIRHVLRPFRGVERFRFRARGCG
jgi:hypothetical protein